MGKQLVGQDGGSPQEVQAKSASQPVDIRVAGEATEEFFARVLVERRCGIIMVGIQTVSGRA